MERYEHCQEVCCFLCSGQVAMHNSTSDAVVMSFTQENAVDQHRMGTVT